MNQYARRRVRGHRRSYYGNLLMTALIFLIVAVIVLTAKMFSVTISMGGFSRLERLELPSLLSEEETADLERGLFEYFHSHEDEMPKQFVYADEPLERRVCDYISTMSDQYAVRTFERLTVPQSWSKL